MNGQIITHVLNEKQFAKAVGLSYAKVKQMRQRGDIKCVRVGRRVLYRCPEHVEAFLNKFEIVS
jgi:predicted transcriptional regulator